jgi:hypothetical protein
MAAKVAALAWQHWGFDRVFNTTTLESVFVEPQH